MIHTTLTCINDKTFHNFLQTINLNLINTTNEDNVNLPLIFKTLLIWNWSLLLETSNIDNKMGLTKLKEIFAFLNAILKNDKEIEEVASIITPLDVVLAKANATNPKDLLIIPSNVLTNHPLFSILQVPKVDKTTCNDFKENISIFQMEVNCAMLRNRVKYPHAHCFPTKQSNWMYSIHRQDAAFAKYKFFGTNL